MKDQILMACLIFQSGTEQLPEWLLLKSLREEDIMTVDFDFVNVMEGISVLC